MTEHHSVRVPRWQAAVIVAVTGVVYLNSFRNEFLWDDLHLIVGNPAIKHWSRAPGLFLTELFPHGILSGYYRPLQVPLDQHMERLVAPAASCFDAPVLGAVIVIGLILAAAFACRRKAWPVVSTPHGTRE